MIWFLSCLLQIGSDPINDRDVFVDQGYDFVSHIDTQEIFAMLKGKLCSSNQLESCGGATQLDEFATPGSEELAKEANSYLTEVPIPGSNKMETIPRWLWMQRYLGKDMQFWPGLPQFDKYNESGKSLELLLLYFLLLLLIS